MDFKLRHYRIVLRGLWDDFYQLNQEKLDLIMGILDRDISELETGELRDCEVALAAAKQSIKMRTVKEHLQSALISQGCARLMRYCSELSESVAVGTAS